MPQAEIDPEKLKQQVENGFKIIARSNNASKIPEDIQDKFAEIARMHELAALKEIADLKEILGGLADEYRVDTGVGRTESQGVGSSGFPEDTSRGFKTPHEELLNRMPGNTATAPYANAGPSERGGARDLAGAARPSTDPSSWLGGIASQDGSGRRTVTDPDGTEFEEYQDGDTSVRVIRYSNGSFVEHTNTPGTGGRVETVQAYEAESGESSGEVAVYDDDGLVIRTTYKRTRDGETSGSVTVRNGGTYTTHIHGGEGGSQEKPSGDQKPSGKPKDVVTLPGTEAGVRPELARAFARQFDHSAKAGPPEVTKVNPGDPDDSGPKGPRLKPGKGIVDIEEKRSRPITRRQAEHWKQEMQDKAGGRINVEGGGTGPEKP